MQPAREPVAHRPAQHRGPGKLQLARLEHDGFVERPALEPVGLTDENPQQHRFAWHVHDCISPC
jgi:hypothetical protein